MSKPTNVFVIGTGRCGTCTFYQACRSITNFTCGHESQAGKLHLPYLPYHHIEVSSGLMPLMGRLAGDGLDAVWIHLIRNRKDCTESLAASVPDSVIRFAENWFQYHPRPDELLEAAGLLYDTINPLIAEFVRNRRHMTIHLETIEDQWPEFWNEIEAIGDYDRSVATLRRRYNTGNKRGRDNYE